MTWDVQRVSQLLNGIVTSTLFELPELRKGSLLNGWEIKNEVVEPTCLEYTPPIMEIR